MSDCAPKHLRNRSRRTAKVTQASLRRMQRRLAEIKQCTSVPEYLTAPMSRGGRENANLVGRVQPRARLWLVAYCFFWRVRLPTRRATEDTTVLHSMSAHTDHPFFSGCELDGLCGFFFDCLPEGIARFVCAQTSHTGSRPCRAIGPPRSR